MLDLYLVYNDNFSPQIALLMSENYLGETQIIEFFTNVTVYFIYSYMDDTWKHLYENINYKTIFIRNLRDVTMFCLCYFHFIFGALFQIEYCIFLFYWWYRF